LVSSSSGNCSSSNGGAMGQLFAMSNMLKQCCRQQQLTMAAA
jgi:hypothetical protein